MQRKIVLAVAGGACASLVLWLAGSERPVDHVSAEALPVIVEATHVSQEPGQATLQLGAQVDRLQRQIIALGAQLDTQLDRAQEAADEAEQAEQAQAESAALGALDPAVVRGHYEQLFDEQPIDATWSRAEAQTITEHFARGAVTGIELRGVDCHASMCRVQLQVSDASQREPFLRDIGLPPFQHGGYYHNDLGSDEIVLFTAREGQPLPPYLAGS